MRRERGGDGCFALSGSASIEKIFLRRLDKGGRTCYNSQCTGNEGTSTGLPDFREGRILLQASYDGISGTPVRSRCGDTPKRSRPSPLRSQ